MYLHIPEPICSQGLGPIGQCAAKWAKLKGAARVIGIDKYPDRLEFARTQSGIETISFTEFKDVAKRIHELVPGGLDVALDCGKSPHDQYACPKLES